MSVNDFLFQVATCQACESVLADWVRMTAWHPRTILHKRPHQKVFSAAAGTPWKLRQVTTNSGIQYFLWLKIHLKLLWRPSWGMHVFGLHHWDSRCHTFPLTQNDWRFVVGLASSRSKAKLAELVINYMVERKFFVLEDFLRWLSGRNLAVAT